MDPLEESCTFCDIASGNKKDHSFIKKMKRGTLLLNYDQTFWGRCMYIYDMHLPDITAIAPEDLMEAEKEILLVSSVIKRLFNAQLINVASLGNHVQHLHWHIIPRYMNDPNWGNPPWPHDKKELTREAYLDLARKVLAEIDIAENGGGAL